MLRLAKSTATAQKKHLFCFERGGRESFISDISLYNVALMTRSNAYVSAARARNPDAKLSHCPRMASKSKV